MVALFSFPRARELHGFPNRRHFRGEAMAHVDCGWVAGPLPFDAGGNLIGLGIDAVNAEFRFPAIQGGEPERATISNTD